MFKEKKGMISMQTVRKGKVAPESGREEGMKETICPEKCMVHVLSSMVAPPSAALIPRRIVRSSSEMEILVQFSQSDLAYHLELKQFRH